ncbi:MAG: hypothetical protein DMD63_00800 [Gemmatimonadetes bacterium]|nr:MAG: hypothetical protein DMD63_00800 [Gemmatimonadota bacterium]
MLSFLVRPFTDGTVIGGSFDVESLLVPVAVLDAVRPVAGALEEVVLPATSAADATLAGDAWGGMTSPTGVGRASLLAAQATDVISAKGMSTLMDEYLLNQLLGIPEL